MDEQVTTQPATVPPPQSRLFVIVDIEGDPLMVKAYVDLITLNLHTSIEFCRTMSLAAGKKKSKLPFVNVYERQAE